MRFPLPPLAALLLVLGHVPCRAAGLPPDEADGHWSTLDWPNDRYGHSAVLDPVHDRMIVFGGYNGAGYPDAYYGGRVVWILTLSGPQRWTGLYAVGTPPTSRYTQSAIYDSAHDRMILFGGYDGGVLNDVWALSLSGVPTWSPLTASGTPPPARHRHTAVYDPAGDRMIVFGGTNDSTLFADVWALSLSGTPTWNEIVAPGGPTPRYRHSAIYDPVRDRMIAFGGRGASGDLSETWALDLGGVPAWSQIQNAARTRANHTAVYDPAGDRMIVYGGDGATRNDVWSLALSGTPAWSQLVASGSPPPAHSSHTAILDVARNRMVVFAGKTDSSLATGDLSVLALGAGPAWSRIVNPQSPAPEAWHSAIYDPVGSRLVSFAGMTDTGGPINETWSLSLDPAPLWSRIVGPAPVPRKGQVAIYDRLRERMVMYGGFAGINLTMLDFRDEVWSLPLSGPPTWQLAPYVGGTNADFCTTPRSFYDPIEDRMILFVSEAPDQTFPTFWAQPMSQLGHWESLPATGFLHPPQSESPNVIYDPLRDRVILFGGFVADSVPNNNVWAMSLRQRQWTQVPTLGPTPPGRCRYSAVYDPIRDRMLVVGGRGFQGHELNDVWELSLADPMTWRQLSFRYPMPPVLTWSTAVAVPERDWIMVEGGYYGSSALATTWILEGGKPAAPTCQSLGDASWAGNGRLTLRFAASQPLESKRMLTWTLRSARAWPGFPMHGCVTADAAGDTVAADVAVPDSAAAGTNRLTFGVSFTGADGAEVTCTRDLRVPLATLDVPAAASPGFLRIRPNPARREMTAAFSLPVAGRATLELYDIAGRRVSRRELSLGNGTYLMAVAPNRRLAPGLYIVQLSFGGSVLRARGVVVE